MPFVSITTNVAASKIALQPTLAAVSAAMSKAFGKPEAVIMVQLNLDVPMMFQGNTEPCAKVAVRSIGHITPPENTNTLSLINEAVATNIGVSGDRVFMSFEDFETTNWGFKSKLIADL